MSVRGALARAALVATIAIAGVTTTQVQHAWAASDYRPLQFNMCGNVCYDGDPIAATHVGDTILSFRPTIATLNEVCLNQASTLDTYLSLRGYAMTVIHYQTLVTQWHRRVQIWQRDPCEGQGIGHDRQ